MACAVLLQQLSVLAPVSAQRLHAENSFFATGVAALPPRYALFYLQKKRSAASHSVFCQFYIAKKRLPQTFSGSLIRTAH